MNKNVIVMLICIVMNACINASDQKIEKAIEQIRTASTWNNSDSEVVFICWKSCPYFDHYYFYNTSRNTYTVYLEDCTPHHGFQLATGDKDREISDQEFNELKTIAQAWIRSQK